MKILDLFCGQGAAAMGYHRAGFDVVGVDIAPQPRYPFEFHRADALEFLADNGSEYDVIHASPPCQRYSATQRIMRNDHPDLIGKVRTLAERIGAPFLIENVEGARAALRDPITLCGQSFGLHTYRHRLFESSMPLAAPTHNEHRVAHVKMGRPLREGDWYHAVGNFSNVPYVRRDLGVPWMTRDGIRECVPPAYTEYLGRQLLAQAGGLDRTSAQREPGEPPTRDADATTAFSRHGTGVAT